MKIKTYSLEELKKEYNLVEYNEWYFIKGKLQRYRLYKDSMVNALIDKELIVSRGYTSTNIFPYKYKGWSIPSWIIKEEDISKEPIQLEFDLWKADQGKNQEVITRYL